MTTETIKAAFQTLALLGKVIHDAKEIPAGTLYATVCGTLSLEQFSSAIGLLEKNNLVRRDKSHMLRWIEA